jgi:UDP-N-acetylglucosamine--N-acetylmuramyl-(pentapeptide) pyrophosphoryl-undecaprenol N-acetylglucosamine transferase
MAAIHYAVHGHGRGHASRARAVVARLVEVGHRVTLLAGGDGLSLLTELVDASHGAVTLTPRTPILPGPDAIPTLLGRAQADFRRLRKVRPALVVSDGDQALLLAARMAGVPSLAIGHDLVFSACALPPGLPAASLARERANSLVPTHLSDARIAVHFLPIAPARPGTHVARPRPPERVETSSVELPKYPYLLAYLSDGDREDVLARLAAADVDVVVFGEGLAPRGRVRVEPVSRARFAAHLARAAGVVATAGSNVLAECVLARRPVLALHTGKHHEQALNAALVAQAGIGRASRIDALDAEVVRAFARRAGEGGFACVDLASALPPVDEVALACVTQRLAAR